MFLRSRWKTPVSRICNGLLLAALCLCVSSQAPAQQERKADKTASSSPFAIRGIKGLWWEGVDSYRQALPWLAAHDFNFLMLCYTSFPASGAAWRTDYSPTEQQQLHALAAQADRLGVHLCLAFNPGLWSKPPLSYASESDYQAMLRKVQSVHALGIHWFALCLDDIGRELQPEDKRRFGTLQAAQVHLINRLWNDIKTLRPAPKLIFCPSAYTTEDARQHLDYIQTLGAGVDPAVMMFWTGPSVCSPSITAADARTFGAWIRRKPIVWDNYPVNDMFPWRPLLGAVKNRSADLPTAASGFMANAMKQWPLCPIPLTTLSLYLNDPAGYRPAAALEKALRSFPKAEQPVLRRLVALYGSSFWGEPDFPPKPRPANRAEAGKLLASYTRLRKALSANVSLAATWNAVQPTLDADIAQLERAADVYKRADPLRAEGPDFDGGAGILYGFRFYNRPVNYVYAAETGKNRMWADFDLPRIPKDGITLLMTARDDDSGKKLRIGITFNALTLCSGDSPFSSAGFTTKLFAIPAAALKPGRNRLLIENLETKGPLSSPPWFMVTSAKLLLKSPDRLTAAEREALAEPDQTDPIARVELRGNADPTFARVARHYPPMKFPRELVGVPAHPNDIGIDYLGRIQFTGDLGDQNSPLLWFEIGDPAQPLASADAPWKRGLLDGHLPIVVLSGKRQGVAFEQTVFGWSRDFSADSDLFAFVRLKIRVPPGTPLPDHVWLVRRPGDARTRLGVQARNDASGDVYLRIPYSHTDEFKEVSRADFERLLAATRLYWNRLLQRGMTLELPEKRVNAAWKAWLAYSLLDIDRRDGYDEPHDGSGFYPMIYGYSALLYTHALDLYGHHEQAKRCLDCLLHFQQPDGLYTQNFGLPDQGMFLFALAEHYAQTGNLDWLRSVAQPMIRAGDWILQQRAAAPKTGLTAGLIKYRPYCDYPDPTYNYLSDTCCCIGLENAAEALNVLGMKTAANRFRAEAARYRADILRSMDASVVRKGKLAILPIEPDTLRIEKQSGFGGGDYYGLIIGSLLDNEFLAASDRRTQLITDHLERNGGLMAGVCAFDGGIDHAYTYGYLLTKLKRGDVRRYLLGFYGMLAYGMTRDTYSGVEVTKILTGENAPTLPHLFSCTQQLRTLRTMLLREDGDTLRIGEAIPRAWLADGKRIVVGKAPTRFGTVSYTIQSHVRTGRIDIRLDPPHRHPPRRIMIRLRHPDGRTPRAVSLDGRSLKFSGEDLWLDRITKPVRLHVLY